MQRLDPPFIGITGLVGDDRVGVNAWQNGLDPVKGMRLSWRQLKPSGIASRLAGRVDVGGQPALAAPARFLFTRPPFAPAACW